jgi:hypothetical protein
MDFSLINWWAVAVAALSNLVVGALWYSPLVFGKLWLKYTGLTEEQLREGNPLIVYGLTLVFSFVMSFNLAAFLADPSTTVSWGVIAGFLAGFGWAAMTIFVIGLFERKSVGYLMIHGGYATINLVVMGVILGAWR